MLYVALSHGTMLACSAWLCMAGLAWIAPYPNTVGMQTILCMGVAISNPVVTKSFVACQLEDNCIVAGEEPPEMWLSVAVCHHFGHAVPFCSTNAVWISFAAVRHHCSTVHPTSACRLLFAKECFGCQGCIQWCLVCTILQLSMFPAPQGLFSC